MPTWHGVTAFVMMSSVAARFYPPQVAGAGATGGVASGTVYPFRIDHDEKFNQTSNLQYEIPGKHSPWFSLNWRFDSGLVAESTPCYQPNSVDPNTAYPNSSLAPDGTPAMLNGQPAVLLVDNNIPATSNFVTGNNVYLPLTPDQPGSSAAEFKVNGTNQLGVQVAGTPYYECVASQFSSSLVNVPAPAPATTTTTRRASPIGIFSMPPLARTTCSTETDISGVCA